MLRALPLAGGGTMHLQRLVSPTAPAQRLQPYLRAPQPCRRRGVIFVRAAMAGSGSPDPYQVSIVSAPVCLSVTSLTRKASNTRSGISSLHQTHLPAALCVTLYDWGMTAKPQVLGLSPGANSEAVQRSYRRALNDAKGNKGRIEKIEAAHTSIMMSGLTARLKVGAAFRRDPPHFWRFAACMPMDPVKHFAWLPASPPADGLLSFSQEQR